MKLLKNKNSLYIVFPADENNEESRIMKIENGNISWIIESDDNWKELEEAEEIV